MTDDLEPDVIEIRPNSDEEDRYIKMKDMYKQGKQDAEDLLGSGVTGDQMAQEYTDDPDLIQQYLNGWNYVVHYSKED